MLPEWFVYVGSAISALAVLHYAKETLEGKVQPNRVSFFLWSLAPLIAYFAQLSEGAGANSFFTLIVGLEPVIVLIASYISKHASWEIRKFDLICGLLSLIGLLLWYITKVGNIAIFFSIMADGLAAIPTITKSYSNPETESPWIWLTSAFSSLLVLLTVKEWTFQNYGFSLYLMIITLTIFLAIRFSPKRISK